MWAVRSAHRAVIFGMICVAGVSAAQQTPTATPPQELDAATARLIEDLDSPSYTTRVAATEQLAKLGMAAAEPLVAAAEEGSLEVTVRAIAILQGFYQSADDALVAAAETALEMLRRSDNRSAASRANVVLRDNSFIGQQRVLAKLQKLGGVFLDEDNDRVDVTKPARHGKLIQAMVVGSEWKGGDAGLQHVQQLTVLHQMVFVQGTRHVTEQALARLEAARPDLQIQRRGPALLGVTHRSMPGLRECTVHEVRAGSAAAKAGILAKDIITHFEGKPVSSFQELVELISHKQPGDKVKIALRRVKEPPTIEAVTVDVVLGGWKW